MYSRAGPAKPPQSEVRAGRSGIARALARSAAAACLAGMLALAGAAAPEEDYRSGAEAYRRGDMVGAMAPLRRAAEAGHAPSQALLGEILDQAELNEEALGWYRKAAQQGDASGAYGIGTMYLSGDGVKKDSVEAYAWYLRSAEKQHAPAVIALASAYLVAEKGELPPGLDKARAAEWLRKAAALDHLPSVEALARAYRSGAFGVAPDAKEADAYSARAAALRAKSGSEKGRKKR